MQAAIPAARSFSSAIRATTRRTSTRNHPVFGKVYEGLEVIDLKLGKEDIDG